MKFSQSDSLYDASKNQHVCCVRGGLSLLTRLALISYLVRTCNLYL